MEPLFGDRLGDNQKGDQDDVRYTSINYPKLELSITDWALTAAIRNVKDVKVFILPASYNLITQGMFKVALGSFGGKKKKKRVIQRKEYCLLIYLWHNTNTSRPQKISNAFPLGQI